MVLITIVTGANLNQLITGGPHIVYIYGLTMVTVIMVHNADLMGLIQGCAPVC